MLTDMTDRQTWLVGFKGRSRGAVVTSVASLVLGLMIGVEGVMMCIDAIRSLGGVGVERDVMDGATTFLMAGVFVALAWMTLSRSPLNPAVRISLAEHDKVVDVTRFLASLRVPGPVDAEAAEKVIGDIEGLSVFSAEQKHKIIGALRQRIGAGSG